MHVGILAICSQFQFSGLCSQDSGSQVPSPREPVPVSLMLLSHVPGFQFQGSCYQGPMSRVPGSQSLGVPDLGSQSPRSRISGSQLSGCQGPGSQGLRVVGLGCQCPQTHISFPDFRLCPCRAPSANPQQLCGH